MSDHSTLTYAQHMKLRLATLRIQCGDVLETRFSALEADASRQIGRAVEAFVEGFGFVPEELVMHPTLLPENSRHIRQLEVFLARNHEDIERIATNVMGGMAVLGLALGGNLASEGLPTTIKYIFDDDMHPNVVAARYTMPLCEACTYKVRYRAATTPELRAGILEQVMQTGTHLLKQLNEQKEEENEH